MIYKKSKWTLQDFELLRELKQNQICQNRVNWEQIASKINVHTKFKKTPKQCREKYVNYVKVGEITQLNQDWTQNQLQFLIKLYGQFGNSWSYISSQLGNRSENSVKNRVNNGLRKLSNALNKHDIKMIGSSKKTVSPSVLNSNLQFVNQLQKSIKCLGLTVNYASKFFKFRAEIIRLCIKNQEISQEYRIHLVQLIKELSQKIKSLVVFKIRNKKNWKLSQNKIIKICQYDQVIMQEVSKLQERTKSQQKQIHPQQNSQLPNNFQNHSNNISDQFQGLDLPIYFHYDNIQSVKVSSEDTLQKVVSQIIGHEWYVSQQQQRNRTLFSGF